MRSVLTGLSMLIGFTILPMPFGGVVQAAGHSSVASPANRGLPAQFSTDADRAVGKAPTRAPSAAPASIPSPLTAAATIDVALGFYGRLRVGDDFTATLTLTNTTAAALDAGTVQVFFDSARITDPRALTSWFQQSTGAESLGMPLLQVSSPALAAGEAVTLPTLSLPAATFGLTIDTPPGARRVAVRMLAGATPVAEFHTSITTVATPATTTHLAIAMPLVLPPGSGATVSADLIGQYTSPVGVLTRQLDQAYAAPVAIGIDPRILASIRVLGNATPESAILWLARLQSAPNITFPLSFGDSDVAATSQSGAGLLVPSRFVIDPALFPAPPTPPRPPSASPSPSPSGPASNPALPTPEALLAFPYTLSAIAWPRENSVVEADLDTFATAGFTTTILASGNSSLATSANPSAMATIKNRTALISDDAVSALLRDAVQAPTESSWQSAMARLNATLAALTTLAATSPSTRVTLATLDRTPTVPNFRLVETLNALAAMAWTTPASLASALADSPTSASLVARPIAPSRISAFKQLLASEAAVAQYSAILTDPSSLTTERRLAFLALSAQSWAPAETEWNAAVAEYLQRSAGILGAVKVVNSSTINLLSNKGQLPITVNNGLPYPVTVYVVVRSQTAVLDIREPRVKLTIEANSQNRAFVPVQSIANGEVTITVGLVGAAGQAVGQQALATINVQAGWETAATAVLAVLVIGVFVLGIIRTIRRRRQIDIGPKSSRSSR